MYFSRWGSAHSVVAHSPRSIPKTAAKGAGECRMLDVSHLRGNVVDGFCCKLRVGQKRERSLQPFLFNESAEGLTGFLKQDVNISIGQCMPLGHRLGRQARVPQVRENIGADGGQSCDPRSFTSQPL